jgi:transcription elongation factor GreA
MSDAPQASKTLAARLRKMVSKKHYDDLDAAWTAAAETGSIEPDDLISVLEKIVREDDPERAESLLWLLLNERAERDSPTAALDIARRAAPAFPESEMLREELANLYTAAHADHPAVSALLDHTVRAAGPRLDEAVRQMDRLLALQPGRYVLDPSTDQPARVTAFDPAGPALKLELPDGTRTCDVPTALRFEPLDADDFRALMAFDPQRLGEVAWEKPGELVTQILRAFGPRLTFKSMKSRIASVLPARGWTKWWSMARPKLQRAPWVDMTAAASPTFSLRSQPIPYDAILKAQFNAAQEFESKLAIVIDYLKELADGAEPHYDVLSFYETQLDRHIDAWRAERPVAAISALAVAAELHRRYPDHVAAPEHAVESLLPDTDADRATALEAIRNDDLVAWVLVLIRESMPERWPDVFASLMPGLCIGGAAFAAQTLIDADRPEPLQRAVGTVLSRPDRYASALCWLWRTVGPGSPPAALGDVDVGAVALALIAAGAGLARGRARSRPLHAELVKDVRSTVAYRSYEPLRAVLKEMDVERARMIKTYIERVTVFTDQNLRRIGDAVRRAHPELYVEHVPPWEQDAVYTTEAGLERRKQELSHLVTVRLAEASKAVGKAAELGDLSENAEWVAAKEERDRLATTATRMDAEIKKARILTPDIAQSETVTIGSAVRAKRLPDGPEESLVFLGPWDAEQGESVYSYRGRLGLAFMGKAVGETVTHGTGDDERSWAVLEVTPAV